MDIFIRIHSKKRVIKIQVPDDFVVNPHQLLVVCEKPKVEFQVNSIDPKKIHEAMQNAPHDNQPYRQARAAIRELAKEK